MKGSGTHAVLSATLTVAAAAVLTFVDISHAAQAVIRVPQDQPTIQDGIDAAPPGGVVVVAPGTYVENIEIIGKPLTVRSEAGRDATIIDGGQAGVVVSIGATSGKQVLRGFTITNGSEGGIRTGDGAPVIERNLITRNTYCGEGGGITAAFSDAIIRKNIISHNHQAGCSGGPGGGGIIVRGAGEAQVLNNQIIGNSHGSFGGGISLFSAGTPVISGNLIRDNRAGQGGGFWIVNDSDALIVNNIIAENVAGGEGGGVYWLVPSGSTGPTLVNNTIAANMAVRGSAVFADGFDVDARIFNNLLVGAGTAAVLYCGGFNDPNPPQIFFNDVWNAAAARVTAGSART